MLSFAALMTTRMRSVVTGAKMTDDDAYNIVKTLVEKKADIVAVHKEAESFSLDNQVQERTPIPFHPGALRYFMLRFGRNKVIAFDLNISARTVVVYRANLMTKMQAGSLSELVRMTLVVGGLPTE